MSNIKVKIKYPWKGSDSQYYKSMIENSPDGVDFFNPIKKIGNITNAKKFSKSNNLKKIVRKIASIVNIPNYIFPDKNDNNFDVIHCAHSLYLGKKPWVTDVEMYWNFSASSKISHSKSGMNKIKKTLSRKSCKKIIAWTETAKKQILDALQDDLIAKKITVMPYALPLGKTNTRTDNKINILFSSRYFYAKGGAQALKAIDILTKKYNNVNGFIVGQVPKKIINFYKSNDKMKFFGFIPLEKITNEVYPNSDIFIYPGFSDSFGFVIPEAMSFGIPIISIDRFSRKDLIEDSKTGFILPLEGIKYRKNETNGVDDGIPIIKNEDKLIDSFVSKASLLIEDKELLKKMSKNCLREVSDGKFSLKRRNDALKKIYMEAAESG
jgi:glycosyltransferase involved in cell wall biosynthesis